MPSLMGLGYRAPPGAKKIDCFCLSVTLLNDRVCKRHFAMIALEYGNDLDIV